MVARRFLFQVTSLLLVVVCLSIKVVGQDQDLSVLSKRTIENLDDFHEKYPQEKLFLQTDRTIYTAGETIWMKALLTLDGKPKALSQIIYIDVVSDNGDVVSKNMYKLDSLYSTMADLLLPLNIKSGTYQLRAYSLWMLNFKEFVFSTSIFVYGTDYNTKLKSNTSSSFLIQFFPEGGNLIDNVESRIAVKVYDNFGNGILINNGIVKNNAGDIVASFKTDHDGMGIFSVIPLQNEKYFVSAKNIIDDPVLLPASLREGIVIKVNNTSANRVALTINRNSINQQQYDKVLIVAQMHNTVVYSAVLNFTEGATAAAISKKSLPPGILQITVFDEQGNPLAERLAFIKNLQASSFLIKQQKIDFSAKAKNTITFDTGFPIKANLSACIIDVTNDSISSPVNILSSLLLTSDLRGLINNPNYYFEKNDSATNLHLDLLMMTQGWRRFQWNKVLSKEMHQLKFPVESTLVIKGKVTKPGSSTRITNGNVSLLIKGVDSTTLLAVANITDKGEFMVGDLNIKKEATLFYQGTNAKKENLVVDVDLYPSYIDTIKKVGIDINSLIGNNKKMNYDFSNNKYFVDKINFADSIYKTIYLENVTIKTKRLSIPDSLNNAYATNMFENGGRRLNPGNTNYFSIWQLVRTVPGFVVEGNLTNPTVSLSRMAGLNVFSDNTSLTEDNTDATGTSVNYVENGIAFFLNEVPVSKDIIDGITMDDVAFMKTYVGPESAMIGPYNGVISVYTKNGKNVGTSILDKIFTKAKITGYAVPREYYSINYAINAEAKISPDNRITLLWKPYVVLDANGKATISFYNNDSAKKIQLLIQGIDNTGRIYYYKHLFE